MKIGATVVLEAPLEALFGYLSDPARRPEWQRTLRSVDVLDPGPPHVGQRWVDHIMVGARPQLETTRLEGPADGVAVWAERGIWGGVAAELTLTLTTLSAGTRVRAEGSMTGRGPAWVLAAVMATAANAELARDLTRAGTLVASGS